MNAPKQPLNDTPSGWLILDKPAGITSAHAVGKVKRLLRPKKIGHGGTLDPMATGILPLALNEATKAFQYVAANTKSYRFTIRWGQETTTDDAEGEVTRSSDARPDRAAIEAALPRFTGEIMQAPPAFSAIKVNGQRAYDRARAGEDVQLAERPVRVDRLTLLDTPDADHATLEMVCGKGTYVRSIARDLGQELGCLGHVTVLRRTEVGKFHENRAISLEKLEDIVHSGALKEWLLPISSVLADIPALELDPEATRRMKHGQTVMLPPAEAARLNLEHGEITVQVTSAGTLIAMATASDGQLKPVRIFHV